MPAGLAVGDVCGEHEDGDGGDREAQDDDELGKVRLVCVVGVLVVDEEVDIEDEDEDAHDYGDDQESEVEVAHSNRRKILVPAIPRVPSATPAEEHRPWWWRRGGRGGDWGRRRPGNLAGFGFRKRKEGKEELAAITNLSPEC